MHTALLLENSAKVNCAIIWDLLCVDSSWFDSHLSYLPAVQKTVQILSLRPVRQRRVIPGFVVVGPKQSGGCACVEKKKKQPTDVYGVSTAAHVCWPC